MVKKAWERLIRKYTIHDLFRNGSAHKFYRLKALITLEQVNTSVVEKKNLYFDREASGSGVVNFYRMQMRLVMSM